MYDETKRIEINTHTVLLKKPLQQSLRILHLSDMHFAGPSQTLERFFDRLSGQEFDFIFLTGDIMDCVSGIPACVANLKKLKSKTGIHAVLGNHDYFDYTFLDAIIHNFPGQKQPRTLQKTDLLVDALLRNGIHLMRNENKRIHYGPDELWLYGLDDATTGHANIRKTLDPFNPRHTNFLLTHTIDVFLDLGNDEIDLSFSGHSHGGQICLPFLGPILTHTILGRKYAEGIKRMKGAVCCVSRGIGAGRWIPFRLLCRPEAIILTVEGKKH